MLVAHTPGSEFSRHDDSSWCLAPRVKWAVGVCVIATLAESGVFYAARNLSSGQRSHAKQSGGRCDALASWLEKESPLLFFFLFIAAPRWFESTRWPFPECGFKVDPARVVGVVSLPELSTPSAVAARGELRAGREKSPNGSLMKPLP